MTNLNTYHVTPLLSPAFYCAEDPSRLTDLPCSVFVVRFSAKRAGVRADMSQSTVDVAGRVTVEELHSPFFFFFSFLSSLPLCIYADDKLCCLLPPA